MTTCFLYTKHLNKEGCLSLRLNDDGSLDMPLEQRCFADLKNLQTNYPTIIIETTEQATLLEVELPLLSEKKARAAIPYAVEDKLAQPVDQLHFAFDRNHYQNHRYLVAILDKERIKQVLNQLKHHAIDFEYMTLDWFALDKNEMCMVEDTLLVNHNDFKGALSSDLTEMYLKTALNHKMHTFSDSIIKPSNSEYDYSDQPSFQWIGTRLLNSSGIDLCQGDMQQKQHVRHLTRGYQFLAAMALLWLSTLLITDLLKLHYLNNEIKTIDEHIRVIYNEFFPKAKQVISPKFRIEQLLATTSSSKTTLWYLLSHLSKALQNHHLVIEKLSFQNNSLSISVASPDFASLEQLVNQLQQLQLNVNQTQAATRNDQVIATLELM